MSSVFTKAQSAARTAEDRTAPQDITPQRINCCDCSSIFSGENVVILCTEQKERHKRSSFWSEMLSRAEVHHSAVFAHVSLYPLSTQVQVCTKQYRCLSEGLAKMKYTLMRTSNSNFTPPCFVSHDQVLCRFRPPC